MGILSDNNQLYYYFKLRNGVEYAIKEMVTQINTNIMRNFRELTPEQREFHLANPTASVQEVVNCELTPPYVPPTPDLQEYIDKKLSELKEACYNAVTVTSLEFAMAIDKANNLTADCYYNITQARQVLSDFRSQTKAAMGVYDTYKLQIEEAESIEAVDTLYNEAIAQLSE
jgi:hypothetical protein